MLSGTSPRRAARPRPRRSARCRAAPMLVMPLREEATRGRRPHPLSSLARSSLTTLASTARRQSVSRLGVEPREVGCFVVLHAATRGRPGVGACGRAHLSPAGRAPQPARPCPAREPGRCAGQPPGEPLTLPGLTRCQSRQFGHQVATDGAPGRWCLRLPRCRAAARTWSSSPTYRGCPELRPGWLFVPLTGLAAVDALETGHAARAATAAIKIRRRKTGNSSREAPGRRTASARGASV